MATWLRGSGYLVDPSGALQTIAEVNEFPRSAGNIDGYSCSGDLMATSLCIDAGTPVGSPLWDRRGAPRDAFPDIGPVEYTP